MTIAQKCISEPLSSTKKDLDTVICGTSVKNLLSASSMYHVSNGHLSSNECHFFYRERRKKAEQFEMLIHIGLKKAAEHGVFFSMNKGDVITSYSATTATATGPAVDCRLSPRNGDGELCDIPVECIHRVVDNREGCKGILRYQSASDPEMAYIDKSVLENSQKKIYHATFWANCSNILANGLLPNERNSFGYQLGEHVHCTLNGLKFVGLDRRPDVLVEIDPSRLDGALSRLSLLPENTETVLIQGTVPTSAFKNVTPVVPTAMPSELGGIIPFDSIPTVDFSKPEDEIIEVLRKAMKIGFMQAINHSVDQELCTGMLDLARDFFNLPQSTKDSYGISAGEVRGYFGKGQENTDGAIDSKAFDDPDASKKNLRIDNKEGFDMKGCEGDGGGAASIKGRSFINQCSWPNKEIPNFQELATSYQKQMLTFARRMLHLIGKALDLEDPEVFLRSVDEPVSTNRMLHYWPLENFEQEISIGAHTDYGLLTILLQDSVGGLQVLNGDDEWVHCPPMEGAMVCNFGDMLKRWTNGLCRSTIHRVVNVAPTDRYSVPFFLEPKFDTVINPALLKIKDAPEESATCEEILLGFYGYTNLQK